MKMFYLGLKNREKAIKRGLIHYLKHTKKHIKTNLAEQIIKQGQAVLFAESNF
jgi:hypothetical protein